MRKIKRDIDFKYNMREYWSLLSNYKFLFATILSIALILAAIMVLTPFLFKVIVDQGTEYAAGNLDRELFVETLLIIAGIFLASRLTRTLLKWIYLHLINNLDANLMLDIKRKFFNHIVHLSHNFHTSHKTGSLISRIMRGSSAIERMTDVLIFNTAPLLFQLIVVGASMLYFTWVPALVAFITILVFIGYSFIIQQMQREYNVIANETEDVEKAHLSDFMMNIDSIKHFGKEDGIKNKFLKLIKNTKVAMLKHWGYFRWLDAGQSLILGIGTFLIIYFPIVAFLNGEMTLGTVVFIHTVFGTVMGPLFGFVHGIRNYYRAMADFESLFQYGKIENDIQDKPNAKALKIENGDIEFKNVSFRYHEKKGLLKNFSLRIPKNKKVAFVGHSGSGKSTLVKLIYRLYDVNSGGILIDGKDIKDIKQESLRSELSIVPQECILFDDSIYNNIKFSNPRATKKEVMRAIKFAQLDRVVNDFPYKEHTIVGERGVKLSGGEKQRVSIARAILANKKVLLLDEATSSLDSHTEYEIQKDLERLMKGRTSIIIAHRLSTIMQADTIVVLKKGKIIQKGPHNELIQQEGEYKKLWNLQKGGYIK